MDEQTSPVTASTPKASGSKKGAKGSVWRYARRNLLGLVILVIIVVVAVWWAVDSRGANTMRQVNGNEYQAVFLTNGQVYFGKLVAYNHNFVKIKDIYYLQVQQSVQPAGSNSGNSSSNSSSANNASLVKLGNELHGPEDQMFIPPDQVLFWENLKPSGKVSQAITQYQNQNK